MDIVKQNIRAVGNSIRLEDFLYWDGLRNLVEATKSLKDYKIKINEIYKFIIT